MDAVIIEWRVRARDAVWPHLSFAVRPQRSGERICLWCFRLDRDGRFVFSDVRSRSIRYPGRSGRASCALLAADAVDLQHHHGHGLFRVKSEKRGGVRMVNVWLTRPPKSKTRANGIFQSLERGEGEGSRRPYSAACAFTSADTWRMAPASCSAGCAPDTAYFCAKTKVGTPDMPLSEAALACAEIRSTSSSLAGRRRTSCA